MSLTRRLRQHLDSLVNKAYARLALGIPLRRLAGLAVKTIGGYRIAHRPGTSDDEVLDHSFDHDIFFAGVPMAVSHPIACASQHRQGLEQAWRIGASLGA